MKTISISQIIELNNILKNKGLHFKIHMHDACGGQSFSIEAEDKAACEGYYDEMYETIDEFFEKEHTELNYYEGKMGFGVK